MEEDEDTIETGSALEKSCPSPPLIVGSPEIPLQSSPVESPLGGSFDQLTEGRRGQSVRDSVSSEESEEEEEEEEMEVGGGATSLKLSAENPQQQRSSLEHDHAYFASSVETQGDTPVEMEAESVGEGSVAVGPAAAQLADHAYCNTGRPGDLEHQQTLSETSSDQAELRSKLSSDVPDHTYCRQLVSNSPGASSDIPADQLAVGDVVSNELCDNSAESQDLFSENDEQVVDEPPPPPVEESLPPLPQVSDAASQTLPPETKETSTSTVSLSNGPVPLDLDVGRALSTYINGVLGREDLSVDSLWELHQQLMCGLFKVSERLRAESV